MMVQSLCNKLTEKKVVWEGASKAILNSVIYLYEADNPDVIERNL